MCERDEDGVCVCVCVCRPEKKVMLRSLKRFDDEDHALCVCVCLSFCARDGVVHTHISSKNLIILCLPFHTFRPTFKILKKSYNDNISSSYLNNHTHTKHR